MRFTDFPLVCIHFLAGPSAWVEDTATTGLEVSRASGSTDGEVWSLWGSSWWDASQAIGTLAAVLVALGLAAVESARARRAERERDALQTEHRVQERHRVAALVAAWVEVEYAPSVDGTHYLQRGVVFLANGSDEPVFNVYTVVAAGEPPVQLGPLAVPVPLRVLPARHTRQWDISLGLLAWTSGEGKMPAEPSARIDFSDARGVRWHKDFSGSLTDCPNGGSALLDRDEEAGLAQLGDLSNPFNPMGVAMAFRALAHEGPAVSTLHEVLQLLEPNAEGWKNFNVEQWREIRDGLANYGMAAHPWYPAPYVAYVRLVHDDDADMQITEAGFVGVRAQLLTLTFVPERGWRIFSVGGSTEPDWITFPKSSLTRGPRGEIQS